MVPSAVDHCTSTRYAVVARYHADRLPATDREACQPAGREAVASGERGRGRSVETQTELISVGDAARRLERSTEQVRRYLREGRLSGRRIGGQWFIEARAVGTFLGSLREGQNFLGRVLPSDRRDPLTTVIGIGRGGGSNVADGKDAYRRAFWWRR